jgi:hypothetical protein
MVQAWRFFAAAPWRDVQATPQAQQKVVPVSGGGLGGVKIMDRKEIAEVIPYKLSWGCPGGREEGKLPGIRPISPSPSRFPRLTAPVRRETGFVISSRNAPSEWLRVRCVRSRMSGILNRLLDRSEGVAICRDFPLSTRRRILVRGLRRKRRRIFTDLRAFFCTEKSV